MIRILLISTVLFFGALAVWQPASIQLLANAVGLSTTDNMEVGVTAKPSALAIKRLDIPAGQLRVNTNNHLIIDQQLQLWLDGWLAIEGQWSFHQVMAEMLGQINQLPMPGRSDALNILGRWIDYRADIPAVSLSSSAVGQQQAYQLQQVYFNNREIKALFGNSDSANQSY